MTDDFLSDDDKALFRTHMRSVKPLNQKEKIKTDKTHPKPVIRKKTPSQPIPVKKTIHLSDFIQEEVQSDTVLNWSRNSLPTSRFREFKKGVLRWEACIDLHGFNPDEARDKVCHFILKNSAAGKRCLLIIHGRGSYKGEAPVLKNLINRWLPQIDEVLAFHSAHPKDGGLGAVYVLLKRIR